MYAGARIWSETYGKENVMLSSHEREKLLREMHREPVWALGVVLKCAACLLIVAGLAWIGASTESRQDVVAGAEEAGASMQYRAHPSITDAKKNLEERRKHFEAPTINARTMNPRSEPTALESTIVH